MKMLPVAMLVASLATGSAAASASVVSLGGTLARACYLAAEARQATQAAIDGCDHSLEVEPLSRDDRVATFVNRGVLLMQIGRLDRAAADFDAAQRIDPSEPEAYLNQALLLVRRESGWREARALFDQALSHNTRRPELAYYGRGIAAEMVGDVAGAYADYKRAREIAPAWKEPAIELARFSVRRKA